MAYHARRIGACATAGAQLNALFLRAISTMLKAILAVAAVLIATTGCLQRVASSLTTAVAPPNVLHSVLSTSQGRVLPVVTGPPLTIVGTSLRPAIRRRLPNLGVDPVKSGSGFAVFRLHGDIGAYDLLNGRVVWRRTVSSTFNPEGVAAGILLGSTGVGDFEAFDLTTGKQLWQSFAMDGSATGTPVYDDRLILQHVTEDGATIEQFLFAFDVGNGRLRWYTGSNGILAIDRDRVVVDSTWLEHTPDIYDPMMISAIRLSDGKTLWSSKFAPDRQLNISPNTSVHGSALVNGGYAYVLVNGRWYRYDARNDSPHWRIDGTNFLASLPSGAMLATRAGKLGLATSLPDRLLYRPFALNPPAAMVTDSHGIVYAVAGHDLVRFDREGARRVGAIDCAAPVSLSVWTGWISVFCENRDGEEALLFHEPSIREVRLHLPPARPLHYLHLRTIAEIMEQWCVDCIVPEPNGEAIISSGRDYYGRNEGVTRVSANGRLTYTRVLTKATTGLQLLEDRRGTLWFENNDGVVVSVTRNGVKRAQRFLPSGVAVQTLQIAVDAGGNVWFARGGSRPQVARIDGTRVIALPAGLGEPLALTGARDGSLWEVAYHTLLRVTPGGAIKRFSVPPVPNDVGGAPILLPASGADIWYSNRMQVLRVTPRRVTQRFALPDADLSAQGVAAACDGSVYVSERVPVVVRFRAGHTPVTYRTEKPIDALATGPDCRMWFVSGNTIGLLNGAAASSSW